MSKKFRYILSGACALLAFLSAIAYANGEKGAAEAARSEALKKYGGEVITAVVASRELDVGETLSRANCETKDWIVDFLPAGSITSLDTALGSVLTSPVSAGAPITELALRKSGESLDIPSGCVAMSVSLTDKTGVTASTPVGTKLAAYKIVDGATRLLSSDVSVISTPKTQGSTKDATLTLAIPDKDISAVMSAYADATLRLVQPAADAEGIDKTAGIDSVVPIQTDDHGNEKEEETPDE